eukprot:scaffold464_cov244-Pinguiococcus_pyrenoidosus.AAC.2
MSLSVNCPLLKRSASSSCFSSSTTSLSSSTSPRTSPMPRRRLTKDDGWKTSRSSKCSPVPRNEIGAPVAATAPSAPPPLAWPSSLVRMTEPTFTLSLKADACAKTAWPWRVFLTVPSGGVHDDDFVVITPELRHSLLRDAHRVGLGVAAVEGAAKLGGVLLELVKSAGSEGIRAHHRGSPALALVVVRHLGHRGGLAAALEAHEHDDVRAALAHLVRLRPGVEHVGELFEHGALDDFPPVHARGAVVQVHLDLDLLAELAHQAHVDVRLQQRATDVSEHLREHLLVHDGGAVQRVQRAGDLVAELIEDHGSRVQGARRDRRSSKIPRRALDPPPSCPALPNDSLVVSRDRDERRATPRRRMDRVDLHGLRGDLTGGTCAETSASWPSRTARQ